MKKTALTNAELFVLRSDLQMFLSFECYDKKYGKKKTMDFLGMTEFFEAPASTRFHHNYPGGLMEHTVEVMTTAVLIYRTLHYVIPDLSDKVDLADLIL